MSQPPVPVTAYTRPGCPYCFRPHRHGPAFTEVNVRTDPEAAAADRWLVNPRAAVVGRLARA